MWQAFQFWIVSKLIGGTRAARRMGVTVGNDCRIFSGNFGSEPWLITIGDCVTITHGVIFMTHDGATWLVRDSRGRRFRFAPISIGDDVFVGINALLLPGVRVGSRCIVAAGSVVTKSVPDGAVVAGNPARIIGRFEDFERRMLADAPDSSRKQGPTYREQVASIVEKGFRPEMEWPRDARQGSSAP